MQFSPYISITNFLASRGIKPSYVIGLDSSTAGLDATAQYLHGKDLQTGGIAPSLFIGLADLVSRLPSRWIENISRWSGWLDASSPSVVNQVRTETMTRWVTQQYPKRRYPAVMLGSSNGAAAHLCAALGMPWLPQTLLVCLRHSMDLDEPQQAVDWAKSRARQLLQQNPDLWVYQMHDPNQDRVKVPRVIYFRLKQTQLSQSYQQFLQQNLEPGGTIFLLECHYSWLSKQVGDRHLFQVGGKGGVSPEEYVQGSPRITRFLEHQGSPHERWDAPTPVSQWPESEWGFEPSLREDVERFARDHDLQVRRIQFRDPQDFSPLVADLYRWWYKQRGLPSQRLFVESFVYLQPWWTLRLGLVPYWAVFNDTVSLQGLHEYLDQAAPFDEIYANLFSNGIHSLGMASVEQWQAALDRAQQQGRFVGIQPHFYPRDMASFIRHYTDLKKLPGERYPIPEPLTLQQLQAFLAQAGDRYAVSWDL